MSNLLKKVVKMITQIPLWILEVLGFRSEMKEVTNNVKRKKLPKPKAKSGPKPRQKSTPLRVEEVGKAIYLWKNCGMTQAQACAEAGIGTKFLYKRMKKHPRRCENLRKKYAAIATQNKVAPIPKAKTQKVDRPKEWSRKLLSPEQVGRAVWLIEKCGWLVVDACKEAGTNTSTYARWRNRKDLDKALKAYIKKVGKDKALEPNPRSENTKAAKAGKGVRGKQIPKERLGRAIWLIQDCDWVVTHVARETQIAYTTIWSCLKGRHPLTPEEYKAAYLKKAGKNKALELPPTIKMGGSAGSWTTPETWGEVMYLIQEKGWTKAKAFKKFDLNYATMAGVKKKRPGYLNACLELYKESLRNKSPKTVEAAKEFQPTVASPSLKKAIEAPKEVSSVSKKAKVSVPTKPKVGNPSITTEMWGEVMYLHLVNKSPVRMACKAVGVKYSDYLQVDPSHLDKCFKAYVDVPPKENPPKRISSGSGKAIKLKAPAKSNKKVTKPKLTSAQVRRKLDLRPDVAWERLTEACLWQMVELMTPRQACKKAGIKYSVYLEYKELNVTHNGESFRDMANEAEKHREASLLAKKEHERNK